MYKIYYDAYCSPRLKNKAGYCIIVLENGDVSMIETGELRSDITCNQAELEALIRAIRQARTLPDKEIKIIFGDSLLSVNLFNQVNKTKIERLSTLVSLAQFEAMGIKNLREVKWICRKNNLAGNYIEKNIRK